MMTPKQAMKCCEPVDKLLDPQLFKALCDPTRVKLLACLAKCGRACSVSEVAECCSADFSVVSRHLAMLAEAGVLQCKKQGRTVFYTVRYEQLADTLHALASAIEQCCPTSASGQANGDCCAKR